MPRCKLTVDCFSTLGYLDIHLKLEILYQNGSTCRPQLVYGKPTWASCLIRQNEQELRLPL